MPPLFYSNAPCRPRRAGYSFFPTTSRSQLSTLLPVLSQLQRRLAAAGHLAPAFRLLHRLADDAPEHCRLFGRDYCLLVGERWWTAGEGLGRGGVSTG